MTCKRANSVGPFRQVRPCPDRWQTGDEADGWLGLLAPLLPLLAPTKTPTMPRPPPTHFPTWSRDSLDKRGEIQGTYLAPSNLHSRHFGGWNAQNWRQSNLLNCFHEFSQADCRHHDAKCIFRFSVCERHGCKMREASAQCLSDLSMLPCNKPFHACLPQVTNLSKNIIPTSRNPPHSPYLWGPEHPKNTPKKFWVLFDVFCVLGMGQISSWIWLNWWIRKFWWTL